MKFVEKIKTCFTFKKSPPPENRIVYEIMWKNAVEPEATNDNTEHAPCMLDKQGYTHAHTDM